MLEIEVPDSEMYNEELGTFINTKACKLKLEHSLVSLSKWESKWHKPFLSTDVKTSEETLDYIRCMTITPNVDPLVYFQLSQENIAMINDYISNSMTATWFSKQEKTKFSREIVTSELIYYWMVALNIPFECEKWHLNRLLTLVRVCNAKNAPQKKMSKSDILKNNKALNAARKSKMYK